VLSYAAKLKKAFRFLIANAIANAVWQQDAVAAEMLREEAAARAALATDGCRYSTSSSCITIIVQDIRIMLALLTHCCMHLQ
jgi:hypothetical protein